MQSFYKKIMYMNISFALMSKFIWILHLLKYEYYIN